MLRTIIVAMMAGVLGFSCPAFFLVENAWAENGKAASATAVAPASTGTVDGARESSPESGPGDYLIGPGDVLDISVWKDEALTRECVVRPDGDISFPLIGDIKASGKTPAQLRVEMEKQLYRYVHGAALSLEVKQINSLIIYVLGKVNTPGRFVMNADVDVLQALATAGGLNIFAKRNSIKIYRQGEHELIIFPFEYDEVINGKRLQENIRLKRGDVVIIP